MKLAAIAHWKKDGNPQKNTLHVKYGFPYIAGGLLAAFTSELDLANAIKQFRKQRNPQKVKFEIVNLSRMDKHGIKLVRPLSPIDTSFKKQVYRGEYDWGCNGKTGSAEFVSHCLRAMAHTGFIEGEFE